MSHKGGATTTACQREPGAPRRPRPGALGRSQGTRLIAQARTFGPGKATTGPGDPANAWEGPEEGLAKAHEVGGPIATVPWR
jgi:hypothetical protein